MGLTGWLKKKLIGDSDPEEKAFRKEVNAEAKEAEKQAFREQYKISAVEEATKRGKEKAVEKAQKKNQSGSGILNTLAKIGEYSNAASKSLVKGIEINPNGANDTFDFTPQSPNIIPNHSSRQRRFNSYGNSPTVHVHVHEGRNRSTNAKRRRKEKEHDEENELDQLNVADPFNIEEFY